MTDQLPALILSTAFMAQGESQVANIPRGKAFVTRHTNWRQCFIVFTDV